MRRTASRHSTRDIENWNVVTATSDMWTMQLDDDKLLLSDSGSLASYIFTIEQWCFHNKLLSGQYLSSSFVKWIKHLCKILETNALYWKVSWDCILPHTCVYNALWPLMNNMAQIYKPIHGIKENIGLETIYWLLILPLILVTTASFQAC